MGSHIRAVRWVQTNTWTTLSSWESVQFRLALGFGTRNCTRRNWTDSQELSVIHVLSAPIAPRNVGCVALHQTLTVSPNRLQGAT
eukprot:8368814-Pyramimonas_sp.AAC.2